MAFLSKWLLRVAFSGVVVVGAGAGAAFAQVGHAPSALRFGAEAVQSAQNPFQTSLKDADGNSLEFRPVFVVRDAAGELVEVISAQEVDVVEVKDAGGVDGNSEITRGGLIMGSLGWNRSTGINIAAAMILGPTNSASSKGILIEAEAGNRGWQAGAGLGTTGPCDRYSGKCDIVLGLVMTYLDRSRSADNNYAGLRFIGAFKIAQFAFGLVHRVNSVDASDNWRLDAGVGFALKHFLRKV